MCSYFEELLLKGETGERETSIWNVKILADIVWK